MSSITAQRFYGDGSNMSGIFAISVAGFVANDTNGGILTSFEGWYWSYHTNRSI